MTILWFPAMEEAWSLIFSRRESFCDEGEAGAEPSESWSDIGPGREQKLLRVSAQARGVKTPPCHAVAVRDRPSRCADLETPLATMTAGFPRRTNGWSRRSTPVSPTPRIIPSACAADISSGRGGRGGQMTLAPPDGTQSIH